MDVETMKNAADAREQEIADQLGDGLVKLAELARANPKFACQLRWQLDGMYFGLSRAGATASGRERLAELISAGRAGDVPMTIRNDSETADKTVVELRFSDAVAVHLHPGPGETLDMVLAETGLPDGRE